MRACTAHLHAPGPAWCCSSVALWDGPRSPRLLPGGDGVQAFDGPRIDARGDRGIGRTVNSPIAGNE